MAAQRQKGMTDGPGEATRRRLLDAAGEVFAAQGFREATTREICRRAHANIAAVNYHFRGKQGLYQAVIEYAHGCSMQARLEEAAALTSAPPTQRLHSFVRSMLQGICDTSRPAWHARITAREMLEPTDALRRLVDQSIRPLRDTLESIVADLLGHDAAQPTIDRCVRSIVGQCLFYPHCRPVIVRLYPKLRYTPRELDGIADHICRFSIGAMQAIKRTGGAAGATS